MREFEGDLLIGGMRLSHIHGELEMESHDEKAPDWSFSGRIVLTAKECQWLELNRRYRLELVDGRAGLVILLRLDPTQDERYIAVFESLGEPALQG